MPPRTLASLAHALNLAADTDAALLALADALVEVDRSAELALVRFDQRRGMLRERHLPRDGAMDVRSLDTTFDHLPSRERATIAAGGQFVEFGEGSGEIAQLLALPELEEPGLLAIRGIAVDGQLGAMLALYETRKIFGTRTVERFAPSAALFELAYARFVEREARGEAVRTLEDVTQRVHGEYERKLADLEQRLRETSAAGGEGNVVALERELARVNEELRRTRRRAEAVEATVGAAVEQLEKAHVELDRRSQTLRQKTRTLYLLERVLALVVTTDDPRQLVDGLLALVGDDMQAERCSLLLRTPDGEALYIAAARGVAPGVPEGARVVIGTGIAGRVAATRQPLLVRDVTEARDHPLLRDQYFTTGSFISFPLVHLGELIGVVNLANRVRHGVFVDEDVERVRLLGLVIAIVAAQARLPERMMEALSVR